jgi:hypothetical protein
MEQEPCWAGLYSCDGCGEWDDCAGRVFACPLPEGQVKALFTDDGEESGS